MSNAIPPTIYPDGFFTSIQMGNQSIVVVQSVSGLDPPVLPTDATNKEYVDTLIAAVPAPPANAIQFNSNPDGHLQGTSDFLYYQLSQTLALNGNINLNSVGSNITFTENTGVVTGLANPVNPSDATNKHYVDNISFSPGLPAQSLQFNSNPAGSFTGSTNLIYDNIANSITLVGDINLSSSTSTITFTNDTGIITGIVNPINPLDVANKSYVDSAISSAPGLPFTSIQFNSGGILGGSANLQWNVGSNTLTLNGMLSNTGTANSTSASTGSIITSGGVGITKDVYIGGNCHANEFFTTSDERLKSEIDSIDEVDLENLNKINGYSYFLKDDNELKYGFLAGELENNGFDNLIRIVDNYKRINYQSFIPLLLEKIKTLEKRILSLEKS